MSNPIAVPVTRHLKELRETLIRALGALLIACLFGFYYSDLLLGWLIRPLSIKPVFISPAEVFLTDIKIALFSGFTLALPIIFYEVGRFILPGLLNKEQRLFIFSLIFSSVSFYIGVAFAYFIALPFAVTFLISYGQQKGIVPQIAIAQYVDFNLHFLFAFGIIFEFPIIMLLLSKTGLLTVPFLVHARKYMIVAAFFIAAVLTPTPDIFNQCLMAIPIILLYEVGLLAVRWFGPSPSRVITERT